MEQKVFTEYIISRIIDHFPQFNDTCLIKSNDIVYIEFKSKKEKLTLWLTTQNEEVTIGFTGDQECDWHVHMSQFGANIPDEEVKTAVDLIERIINNRELIVHSSVLGFFLTDNIEDIFDYQQVNETIEIYYWGDL